MISLLLVIQSFFLTKIALADHEKNTTFPIKKPKWLPKDTTVVGGIPGGPSEQGPWDSIMLLYDTPQGKILLGQARPENGGEKIFQQDLLNLIFKVNQLKL